MWVSKLKVDMNKGQALVGWLLVIAAGMTLVLATAFRSVSNVKISERDEAAARSFQAAQSALEKAVIEMPTSVLQGEVGEGGFTYDYEAEMVALTGSSFVFPKEVMRDDTQTIWLVEHAIDRTDPSRPRLVADESLPLYEGGSVDLYWGVNNDADYGSYRTTCGGTFYSCGYFEWGECSVSISRYSKFSYN
jgi:uncharacterized iron-regulated membrane protein